jgi:hypothetical protein
MLFIYEDSGCYLESLQPLVLKPSFLSNENEWWSSEFLSTCNLLFSYFNTFLMRSYLSVRYKQMKAFDLVACLNLMLFIDEDSWCYLETFLPLVLKPFFHSNKNEWSSSEFLLTCYLLFTSFNTFLTWYYLPVRYKQMNADVIWTVSYIHIDHSFENTYLIQSSVRITMVQRTTICRAYRFGRCSSTRLIRGLQMTNLSNLKIV